MVITWWIVAFLPSVRFPLLQYHVRIDYAALFDSLSRTRTDVHVWPCLIMGRYLSLSQLFTTKGNHSSIINNTANTVHTVC